MHGVKLMEDPLGRLLAWQPGAVGYTRDDIVVAVGLRSGRQKIAVMDALSGLGLPDKAIGDSREGILAYYFDEDERVAAVFNVADGVVIHFGTVGRHKDNAYRVDAETGLKTTFNMLEEMGAFDGTVFR